MDVICTRSQEPGKKPTNLRSITRTVMTIPCWCNFHCFPHLVKLFEVFFEVFQLLSEVLQLRGQVEVAHSTATRGPCQIPASCTGCSTQSSDTSYYFLEKKCYSFRDIFGKKLNSFFLESNKTLVPSLLNLNIYRGI